MRLEFLYNGLYQELLYEFNSKTIKRNFYTNLTQESIVGTFAQV